MQTATEWALGIFLLLCGSCTTSLGLTIQKLSHLRHPTSTSYTHWLWMIGFSIFLCGQVMNFIAMGFTSQGVAATLGAFSLVANGVFAPLLLSERLTLNILLSICIILAGSTLVVCTTSSPPQQYDLDELMILYERPLFIIWLCILCIGLIIAMCMMKRGGKYDIEDEILYERQSLSINGHTSYMSMHDDDNNDIESSSPSTTPSFTWSSFWPVLTASILSALSLTFGKCTMQLLKTSVTSHNQYIHPFQYTSFIITFVFLICAIASVHYLNVGLRCGEALVVVPIYFVLNTVLTIICGLVYFEEYRSLSPWGAVFFGVGVTMTLVGVYISSRRQLDADTAIGIDTIDVDVDDNDSELDIEDGISPSMDLITSPVMERVGLTPNVIVTVTPHHGSTETITSPIKTDTDIVTTTETDASTETPSHIRPKSLLIHSQSEASLLQPVIVGSTAVTPTPHSAIAKRTFQHTRSASMSAQRPSRVQSDVSLSTNGVRTRRSTGIGFQGYRWRAVQPTRHRHAALFGLGIS